MEVRERGYPSGHPRIKEGKIFYHLVEWGAHSLPGYKDPIDIYNF